MELLIYLFSAAVLIAATLASIAIWAPRVTYTRFAALVVALLFIPLGYVQLIEMLSKPKPVSHEWYDNDVDKAEILGVSLEEGQAIYLWLRLDGAVMPRYYVMPWAQSTAEELEDAVEEAARKNGTIILRQPFYRRSFLETGQMNVEVVLPTLPNHRRSRRKFSTHARRPKKASRRRRGEKGISITLVSYIRAFLLWAAMTFTVPSHAQDAPEVGDRLGDWVFNCRALSATETIYGVSPGISDTRTKNQIMQLTVQNPPMAQPRPFSSSCRKACILPTT